MGGRVAKIAKLLGTPLMPWQRQVADVAGELGPDGRLWYRDVIVTVPRQSGKTTLTLAQMVDRAFSWDRPQRVVYTAQTRNDARRKWEDEHLETLKHSPFHGQYVERKSNGAEAIRWNNGSIHELMATLRKSGHGKTIDLAVIDEAFAQPDNRLEQSCKPAMVTRPDPQLWIVSTAGDETSVYLWEKVQTGRRIAEECDPASRVAYFEWAAAGDADAAEILDTLHLFHPAVGHTIPASAIVSDAETMSVDDVRRAYGNLWTRKDGVVDALPGWSDCEDQRSELTGRVAFGIDASPGLQSTSIGAVGRNADGTLHVEVVAHDLGTAWIVDRMRRLQERWQPLSACLAPSGPAGALLEPLRAAGVKVTEASTGDSAKACGVLFDAVKNRAVVHLGQPSLMAAVDGAVRKKYGDGAWLWDRASSAVDISPLVAVTLGVHGFVEWEAAPIEEPAIWASWG